LNPVSRLYEKEVRLHKRQTIVHWLQCSGLFQVVAFAFHLLSSLQLGDAAPFVEQLSPPVVCRGETTQVEITGQELDGAIELWTSLPGVTLRAKVKGTSEAERAVFDVEVPLDTPLGLYGLRVATRSGLSNVHVFLVDGLPIQTRESQASSKSAEENSAMKIELPASITGICREAAIDRYLIDVQAGQDVSFEVVGNRFGKDYDPLVIVRDQRGRRIVERDNDAGLFFDCRFSHTFETTGTYTVEVRDARFKGNPTWHYVLRMGDFPAAQVAIPSSIKPGGDAVLQLPEVPHPNIEVASRPGLRAGWFFGEFRKASGKMATWIPLHVDNNAAQVESEPNDVAEKANLVALPLAICGVLQTPGDVDHFHLELTKGQSVSVLGVASILGSPADLELVMFHPTGSEAKRVDDISVREGSDTWTMDAMFDFTAREDGLHILRVGDLAGDGGPAFAYRVEVTTSGAKLSLKSEVARITLPQGTYQPIPLKITRSGFAGPISLELRGAPTGVSLEPNTIPEDATEFVCHLMADDSAALSLSTLQIVGHWESEDPVKGSVEAIAVTHPLLDRRIKSKDLILFALRADQVQLPPSLTTRIALMVTSPAPFDVQLPDRLVSVTKYIDAKFPIQTTRNAGFGQPISFTGNGGQIGDESEERSNIFLQFTTATDEMPNVAGLVFNRILTRYEKFRVNFSATAEHEGRRITLNRTFEMDVKAAFAPASEMPTVELQPGETTTVRMLANRATGFTGAVTMAATPLAGFSHPKVIEIPAGQDHFDFQLTADADTAPRQYQLRFTASGQVGKYEESINGPIMSIDVKKPPEEKKPAAK
jgi:hypothetical protein